MPDTGPAGSRRQPTLAVPLAAAKDQLSALVARVEQGDGGMGCSVIWVR